MQYLKKNRNNGTENKFQIQFKKAFLRFTTKQNKNVYLHIVRTDHQKTKTEKKKTDPENSTLGPSLVNFLDFKDKERLFWAVV